VATWTGGGLIGLLVLVAAIVLAVTGRYPRGLYDFILGLNRWMLRVAAHVSLMTDAYPPFRLDSGGTDPATTVIEPSAKSVGWRARVRHLVDQAQFGRHHVGTGRAGMKAFVYEKYGPPEMLQMAEVDQPAPRADEVLVKVMAVSVNPADWHSMRGKPLFSRATLGMLRPRHQILGGDIAGQVETVGSGVTRFKPATRSTPIS
jgi:hypothetical protein